MFFLHGILMSTGDRLESVKILLSIDLIVELFIRKQKERIIA